jgi:hypothetical protein
MFLVIKENKMADKGCASFSEVQVKSKGTMPTTTVDVSDYKAVPQTEKGGINKDFWNGGGQVPAHAKEVPSKSGAYNDPSIDRMAADTSIYKSF